MASYRSLLLLPVYLVAVHASWHTVPSPNSRTATYMLDDPPSNGAAPKFSSGFGSILGILGAKIPDPPGAAPRRQVLETDNKLPGVKRVKIRSGPYVVPNMQRATSPTGEHGMLWNFPDRSIEKPCVECTVLKQWAGLEYPNGTDANIDTGMWLHHMVAFTNGPTRWDPVCYGKLSLPHVAVFQTPAKAERYFTSGNERTAFDFNPGGVDLSKGSGYYISSSDTLSYLVDLMNMNMVDTAVYMTMTYDFLDGPLPTGWEHVKTFWLDVASCMTSEVRAPQQSGAFQITSRPWTPNFEGRLIGAIGHLHDGGIAVDVMMGKDEVLCTTETRYSETPQYRFTGKNMGTDVVAVDHISSMSPCKLSIDRLSKNQAWQVVGKYDYDKRDGNIDRGKQGEIMAISIVLVATGQQQAKAP